jgi:hypothetical protein
MEGAILLAATLGPALLIMALGKTRAWWLPGVALLATMFLCFSSMEPQEHSGSPVDAIGALGNAVMVGAGLWCGLYGGLALLIAGSMRARTKRAALATLSAATVEVPDAEPLPTAHVIKLPSTRT